MVLHWWGSFGLGAGLGEEGFEGPFVRPASGESSVLGPCQVTRESMAEGLMRVWCGWCRSKLYSFLAGSKHLSEVIQNTGVHLHEVTAGWPQRNLQYPLQHSRPLHVKSPLKNLSSRSEVQGFGFAPGPYSS